jgi:hypothetical protein
MYRPTGQVIVVNVFTHIVAAAVRTVTPEMPRYIWEDQWVASSSGFSPSTYLAWEALPIAIQLPV